MNHNHLKTGRCHPRSIPALAVLAISACVISPHGPGSNNIGSMYLKSAVIGPAGGSLTILASDSTALAGTSITVPAGALKQNETIGIAPSALAVQLTGETAAGPVVDFGPDGLEFDSPVTMMIPFTAGESTSDLMVRAVEASGATTELAITSLAGGLATFNATGFTRFGCVHHGNGSSDGGWQNDGGIACPCADVPPNSCTATGPGPCFCPEVVACDGGGNSCMTSYDCGQGYFCSQTSCGSAGTCAPIPQACTQDCMQPELCGCNGQMYCNSCIANGAGTSVDTTGAACSGATDGGAICFCPNVPAGACTVAGSAPCYCPTVVACDGGGNSCMSNSDCHAGNFCSKAGCGGAGICSPKPEGCPQDCTSPEACGCNGESYCNSCLANAAGTNIDSSGATCGGGPVDGGPARCQVDSDCGMCEACVNGTCIPPNPGTCGEPDAGTCACFDANGQCVADPTQCPDADGGVICSCPVSGAGMCTVSGPPPCFCPMAVPCDGGMCACFDTAGNCVTDPTLCGGATDGGSGQACMNNADCGGCPNLCVNGMCVATDVPCPVDAGTVCIDANGSVVPCDGGAGPACMTSADCGGCPFVCSNGVCEATQMACTADAGPGMCVSSNGSTGPCDAGPPPMMCASNRDCPTGEHCKNGICK